MDSGLGVRWPLSPYTTALAAGALFAFCVVFWRHRLSTRQRSEKDPRGRKLGKVESKEKQDEGRKSVPDKNEAKKKRTNNFPVLTFRELNPRFNCENTSLPSPFRHLGAIPRRIQRSHTLEDSQLFTALRRRNVEKGKKNWQELSPAPSNFSCIYQQSICFGNEIPNLNARFELNISTHLHQYLRQFYQLRDFQLPQISSKSDFKNFDVLINPEILKDKPITRSALSLALDRQLHKILNDEPICETELTERSVQTADILTEEEENCENSVSGNKSTHTLKFDGDGDTKISESPDDCNGYNKRIGDDSSLWDSGYCDKSFDERCNTPKELNQLGLPELDAECDSTECAESNDISQDLSTEIYSSAPITSVDSNETVKHNSDKLAKFECEEVDKINFYADTSESFNSAEIQILSDGIPDINSEAHLIKNTPLTLTLENNELPLENNELPLQNKESHEKCHETNATELNSENCTKSHSALENEKFRHLNEIQNEFDDKFSESENETDDILNLYTNILEDFNAGEIKVPHSESENLNYRKNTSTLIADEITKQNTNVLKSCNELNSSFQNISQRKTIECCKDFGKKETGSEPYISDLDIISEYKQSINNLPSKLQNSNLEHFQEQFSKFSELRQKSGCENLFRGSENISVKKKIPDYMTRVSGVDAGDTVKEQSIECSAKNLENTDLEQIQKMSDRGVEKNNIAQSAALESERSERQSSRLGDTAVLDHDVREERLSRDPSMLDEKGAFCSPRQMDRETGERSVAVESTVTTETTLRTNGDAHLSAALVSRLTLDDWSKECFGKDSVSVRTTISEEIYRPSFEEFVPLKSSEKVLKKSEKPHSESLNQYIPLVTKSESNGKLHEHSKDELPPSPRVDRLKGLLTRDEERRARSKFHHLADSGHVGGAMEGEWDRLLRDVLASVSELERWERRHCDVSTDAEDAEQQHHFSQSDSSFTMEEEALSPTKGETPTKVKNLRFKLDPDVFDVPSDDSFYDEDDDDNRRCWRKQSKYRAFSSLELKDEPVRLVSVHASVVPAGQKMVARPVGIDLRVRLTEERQSKRSHVSTSPSQAKRRSPVSDRGVGWCQELSPVTENVDWRETFTPVAAEPKNVPNGILKTPSPKSEPPPVESPNPFKLENGITTNGVSSVPEIKSVDKTKYNGFSWKPSERKPFSLPRKKFEPDPEAVERITGYKIALSKPPLPPPVFNRANANLILKNRAEQARKQYLDSKAALAASRNDGTKKFQQFLNQAQSDRARIVTSVPDLAAIERAVTEQWAKERGSVSPRESPAREDNQKSDDVVPSRGSTPDDAWASYVQSCRQHLGRRSQSMTYLETDIDIIPVLDEDDKCHSTSALDEPDEALPDPDDSDTDRSREDLDDSGRAKSEHELRIERSLRSLPVPEWYSRSEKTKTGFLLGNSAKEKRGWAAAKSLASSTSSLASCGLRRPVRSLRSSRENIPWSRSSASPDGPTLSLALAKAFREPYLGWRARTPTSSGVSSSPRASPPSWGATTTDDEANGVSFDGEDAFGRTISSEDDKRDEPLSLDDTGADAVTVSMDTNDPVKLPGGEDTCDDINNMSMDTCELFDASVVVPVDEDPSPQADTGDDIDNLSTDTTTNENRKLDPKLKRYSYSQSIYHSEWDEEEESRGDHKGKTEDREPSPSSPDHKVVWIESSFVGSRTTTSIMVLPQKNSKNAPGNAQERPASR